MDTQLYHDQKLGQLALAKLQSVFPNASVEEAVTVRSVMDFVGLQVSLPLQSETPTAIRTMRSFMESQQYYIQNSLLDSSCQSERQQDCKSEACVSEWSQQGHFLDHWEEQDMLSLF